ncbi:MAG: alpha/beta fold hydrolase [Alphaproteobacteria bacterium]
MVVTEAVKEIAVAGMPEPRTIDVDGIKTRYYEKGAGEPIVFIYGGNFGTADSASSAYTWSEQLKGLADRFRVIAFDKIGQGHTDNPLNDDYTMAAVVRHAAGFIKAMKLPPVHLAGHSRGGYAATRLTLEYQHLVRSLTIVNSGTLSTAVGTNDVVLGWAPYPAYSRECARWIYENYCFRRAAVTDEWIDSVVQTLSLPKYRISVDKMEKENLKNKMFYPMLAAQKQETVRWLTEGRLQRPTQVVWGFNDRTASVEGGFEMYQMIGAHERRTIMNVINESGHFPFREHPDTFNGLFGRFVQAHSV